MAGLLKKRPLIALAMLLLSLFVIVIPIREEESPRSSVPSLYTGDTIKCNILLDKTLKAKGYTIGYLYELFRLFEDDQGVFIELTPEHFDTAQWRLLADGTVDMLIVNYKDSVPENYQENFISGTHLDKEGVVCVTTKDNYSLIQTLNYWFNNVIHTNEFMDIGSKYYQKYRAQNHYGSRKFNSLSPYDNLIKRYSRPLGWDWRLVASLIYQESQFKAGVSSSRGAIGLMQIKESTGRRYGIDNIYDPEDNIKAGTSYLHSMFDNYTKKGADSLNAILITLAAYNCGEGRIEDCMSVAEHEGKNPLVWDDLKEIIPLLSAEEHYKKPDIKLGKFRGKETIRFVDEITQRYQQYKETVSM